MVTGHLSKKCLSALRSHVNAAYWWESKTMALGDAKFVLAVKVKVLNGVRTIEGRIWSGRGCPGYRCHWLVCTTIRLEGNLFSNMIYSDIRVWLISSLGPRIRCLNVIHTKYFQSETRWCCYHHSDWLNPEVVEDTFRKFGFIWVGTRVQNEGGPIDPGRRAGLGF
jgi:hypothetical protein